MTNVCMKFEKAGPNPTLVIDPTRLYTTDGRLDGQVQSNIPSLLRGEGHDNILSHSLLERVV